MPYNVSFISLGCAKNQVNCEQMMATVQHAGHNVVLSPEGADVAVVNTCGRRGMRTCASPRAATTAVPTASFRACAAVTAAAR